MNPFLNYFAYVACGMLMLAAFVYLYVKATPIDEIALIRQHNMAAACSLGGALLGFAVSLASSAMHQNVLEQFLVWGLLSLFVQLLTYLVLSFTLRNLKQSLEDNNIAVGAFVGAVQLAVGVLNAGSLS